MKSLDTILDENENVYIWDDDHNTIDYCIYDSKQPFIKSLITFECLCCGNLLIDRNEYFIKSIDETVKGSKLRCHGCNQMHFVHLYVNSKT